MTKRSPALKSARRTSKSPDSKTRRTSKLDTLVKLLRGPTGASVQEMATATSWQTHSVRGALAGTLKRKGHAVHSEVVDGLRRYRIVEPSA